MGSIVSGITDAVGLTNVGGQKYEARLAADAQRAAADKAAFESRFRPIGVTTAFGSSQFTRDPKTDLLSEASYTLDPRLRALQDQLFGGVGGDLDYGLGAYNRIMPVEGASQSLFRLGQQYLATSPEEARQRYMDEQMAVLDPIRQREEDRLGSSVFGRGRLGLQVGDMGNPELFGLATARREQDLKLAAQAEQAAQQRLNFGAGLFGTGTDFLNAVPAYQVAAMSPFSNRLGLTETIEGLGQRSLGLGMELGGAISNAGANAGNALLKGGMAAAQTRQQGYNNANAQLNSLMQGAVNAGMGMMGGPSGMFGGSSVSGNASWMNEPWM